MGWLSGLGGLAGWALGGPAGGLIGGGLGSLLGGGDEQAHAYRKAQREMERKWREAQEFQRPYRDAGIGQLDTLKGAESNLLDPSKMLADWMGKYQQSPYAKKSFENAREAGLNAASSQGLLGSSAATQNIQNSSSDIMNADRNEFLQNLMQKYMAGVGIGQNIYNKGADVAGNLGNQAISVGGNTADMQYGASAAKSNYMKDLLGMGAKMYMANQMNNKGNGGSMFDWGWGGV